MPAPGYKHPSKRELKPEDVERFQSMAATGATASIILNQVGPKLDGRAAQVIKEAISMYRSIDSNGAIVMTPEMSLRYWAALSEVIALKEQLVLEENSGVYAYEKLTEGIGNG